MKNRKNHKGIQMNRWIIILTSFTFFALGAITVFSTTYYVVPTGSDSNPGSENLPWRTIQKAANTATAGDFVYVKAGTYKERIVVANSGTAGNYLTFSAYSNDVVTIDGAGITMPGWESGLFDLEDRSYIKISGFRVINAGPNDNNCGIYVDNCHHIIIENNYTYNTVSSGIGIWNCSNVIIEGNEVELACNDGEQECITVAATDSFEIRYNEVHNGGPGTNGGEGIDSKDGSSNGRVYNNHVHNLPVKLGIYIEAWDKHTSDIEIFNNIVYDCGNDGITLASEQGGLLENIYVYNNLVYNNKNIGISVTPNGAVSNSPMKNIKLVNNTIYNNGWDTGSDPWGGGIGIDSPNLADLTIRNNIVSKNLLFQIAIDNAGQNFTTDHNLINGFLGELSEETRGTNYVEGEPGFLNGSGADFHLLISSLALDKGSAIDAPDEDFDGNQRPQGAGYDIGAYEYNPSATGVADVENNPRQLQLFQNYPNPFNAGTVVFYEIPETGRVKLQLFNILGEEIFTLLDKKQEGGSYQVRWNGENNLGEIVSSGVYLYRISVGRYSAVKKALYLK